MSCEMKADMTQDISIVYFALFYGEMNKIQSSGLG